MPEIIAVDQGTTNTKAVLVDDRGQLTGASSVPLAISYPRPGWVEQDPSELWRSVVAAVAGCLDGRSAPVGIALSTQRESVVVWSRRTGEPLGHVLGWQDARTADWCRDRTTADGDALVRARTGLRIDAMFSAPKISWLLGELSDHDQADICVGTVDSWLLWRLTGGRRHVGEAGNASRTLLYDVVDLRWSDELAELFDVPLAVLPEIERSDGDFGVTDGVPGLPDGVPVLAVLADSHAALFAQLSGPGSATKATYGTGTSVMTPTERFVPGTSAVPSTLAWLTETAVYAREGNIVASGATLTWTARLLGRSVPELLELAASVPPGTATLVPAFTGLGAPHWDRDVRGVITGLEPDTDAATLARAAVEAVAHQVCDILDEVGRDNAIGTLRADGGATAADLLMQTQADLAGVPVEVSDLAELSALGSAALAWRRLGVELPVRGPGRRFRPDIAPDARARRRERWRAELAWLRSRPR